MIDHIGIDVADYNKSKDFYIKAFAPLGLDIVMEVTAEQSGSVEFAGMGPKDKAIFWFGEGENAAKSMHIAFTAPDRFAVDAFYKAALKAGGKDNGEPGLRPHYHENYYGAFVFDPDGNNIEAVCHTPA